MNNDTLKPNDVLLNAEETGFVKSSIVQSVCDHRPGKFLGQSFSSNYERYQCADCGEEFNRYIENR